MTLVCQLIKVGEGGVEMLQKLPVLMPATGASENHVCISRETVVSPSARDIFGIILGGGGGQRLSLITLYLYLLTTQKCIMDIPDV